MAREVQPGIFDRRLDPLAAFLHGGIRQANNDDGRQAVAEIHFDLDDDAFESDDGAGVDAGKHVLSLDEFEGNVNRLAAAGRFEQGQDGGHVSAAVFQADKRRLAEQHRVGRVFHFAAVKVLAGDFDPFERLAPMRVHDLVAARLERDRDVEGGLAADDFHEGPEGGTEAAVELGVDSVLEAHLPDEGQIGSPRTLRQAQGGACNLPAENLERFGPDEVAATVLFYGIYGVDFSKVKSKIMGHFSDNDEWEPLEGVRAVEAEMKAAGLDVTLHVYPGVSHWFVESDRPEYDPAAAQLAWERAVAFLKENLG